jgi:hypothetical protein
MPKQSPVESGIFLARDRYRDLCKKASNKLVVLSGFAVFPAKLTL